MPNETTNLQIRLPVNMREWLRQTAKQNDRSMSAEIKRMLKQKMEASTKDQVH